MILLSIDELQPGMIVARSVLSGTNVQLAAGYVLDEKGIHRCRHSGMHSLWVKLEGEDILPPGNLNDQLALQAQKAWKRSEQEIASINGTKEITLEKLQAFKAEPERFHNIVAAEQLKSIVENIIQSILSQEPLTLNLASIRTRDAYQYQHAVDTAITVSQAFPGGIRGGGGPFQSGTQGETGNPAPFRQVSQEDFSIPRGFGAGAGHGNTIRVPRRFPRALSLPIPAPIPFPGGIRPV